MAETSIQQIFPALPESWSPYLSEEWQQPYMQALANFLTGEDLSCVFPTVDQWFKALELTPFNATKVVILGQDPYHGRSDGKAQAEGLSFSVPYDQKIPPSLRNIYKELVADTGVTMPDHGHLSHWAEQGVLLLNATLTVREGVAGSHQKQGWELFTDAIIRSLNERRKRVVFLLWGSYAQKKGEFIDKDKHLVLTAHHPSPLSAHRGFFGCQHFSKTNQYLAGHGFDPIDWSLDTHQRALF